MACFNKSFFFLFNTLLYLGCQPTGEHSRRATVIAASNQKTAYVTTFEEWFADTRPLVSAHRGGPYPGYPENAIETFQNILYQTPAIIECDVSMTKDSVLILMHDRTVDRTTTGSGALDNMKWNSIKDLRLVDNEGDTTSFRVPTLKQALAWGSGKALFTLDIKKGVPFDEVIAVMEKFDAASYAAVITYRMQDAMHVYTLNPKIIISVSGGDDGALGQISRSGIPKENLLAFVGTREPEIKHYEKLEKMGIKTILGTLGNLDKRATARGDDHVYMTYVENGADIIATDRPLEVAKVLDADFDK